MFNNELKFIFNFGGDNYNFSCPKHIDMILMQNFKLACDFYF